MGREGKSRYRFSSDPNDKGRTIFFHTNGTKRGNTGRKFNKKIKRLQKKGEN